MLKTTPLLAVLVILSACSSRGYLRSGERVDSATIEEIWVANFRATQAPLPGQKTPPRPTNMKFEKYDVSVPQSHKPGIVEWPKREPDAQTDFVTVGATGYRDIHRFASLVAQADKKRDNTTVLFVHGYNVNHGEAVYQLAQVRRDFEIHVPTVLFSWPSAEVAAGYVYDRDSALYARDQLEELIVALTKGNGRKLVIMAHSMGNFLVMETLRQIEISGSVSIPDKIDALLMYSPDIDGELFHTQASRIRKLPNPSVIFAANQDRALRISAILTGKTNRLGSATDRSAVGGLPITVVDVSAQSNGGLNHSVALTSPAAIAILKKMSRSEIIRKSLSLKHKVKKHLALSEL